MPIRWSPGCNCCEGECDIVADFTFDQPNQFNDLLWEFTDTSTSSATIITWVWDFGDGNGSNEQNPQHEYAAYGIYDVTLTVTDDNGCQDSITKQLIVGSVCNPCGLMPPEMIVELPADVFGPSQVGECNHCDPGAFAGQYVLKMINACNWSYTESLVNCIAPLGCAEPVFDPSLLLIIEARVFCFQPPCYFDLDVRLVYQESLTGEDCLGTRISYRLPVSSGGDCKGNIVFPYDRTIQEDLCLKGAANSINAIV